MLRDQEGNTIEVKGTPMASNNHRLILGKSGYGKTWCCYRMIEEAVEQKKKCVIFDYSGSYTTEEQERSKFASRDQTYVFDGTQPGITYWYAGKNVYSAFEEALIVALPFRGHRQREFLHKVMELLKEQEKELTFASVISVLDGYVQGLTDDESKERGEKLLDIIGQYEKLDIIFRKKTPEMDKELEDNNLVTIMQFTELEGGTKKFLTEFMSELLWQSVKDGANSADYILYDEFQNVALGKGSTLGAMLREGRKYGLGVWLATQILSNYEPEQIDTLQQVDTMLLFRPSERSMKGIAQLVDCEAWKSWRRALWELPKGQAILKGKYSVNHNSKIWDIPIICAVDSKSSN